MRHRSWLGILAWACLQAGGPQDTRPPRPPEETWPELATQARIYTVRLEPRQNEAWVDQSLNLSQDQALFGCRIVAYRIRWFSGTWSGWFVPGVNDLYRKPGEPLRRYWACFNDHAFEIIYQTPKDPIPFQGVLP